MTAFTETFSRTRQPVLLGIAFLILVMIGATTVWLTQQSNRTSALVTHTLETQNAISLLSLSVRRTESAQRGYLLTGDPAFRESYRQERLLAQQRADELQRVISNDPKQRITMDQVAKTLAAKIAEMDTTVQHYESGDRDGAAAIVRDGFGARTMEQLRRQMISLAAEERRLLDEHQAAAAASDNQLPVISLAGLGLIVLIGALSVVLVQRSSRDRQRALAELEATNANLETIIEHRTSDLTEANEDIQRFAYIVSHDLRSPLVNIMGFTTELENFRQDLFREVAALQEQLAALQATNDERDTSIGRLGQEFDEAIGFIKASITKMDRLINAVLRLSREGRREFKPERLDMTGLLKAIEASVTHQTAAANATIMVHDLPDITSDRLAVEQIFSNLIDNAIKYLRKDVAGQIEVTGQVTSSLAIFEVRDNGRGIEPADHQRIFDLFRRAGPQDRPGEGIGLAHVRALVRRLGGYMRVSSELDKGSVFTVTLPRRFGQIRERKAA